MAPPDATAQAERVEILHQFVDDHIVDGAAGDTSPANGTTSLEAGLATVVAQYQEWSDAR